MTEADRVEPNAIANGIASVTGRGADPQRKTTFKFFAKYFNGVALIVLLHCALWTTPAWAAPVVLEDIEYEEAAAPELGWAFRVLFSMPVRYVRHVPTRKGSSVEISVEILGQVDLLEILTSGPEVLQPPKQAESILQDVRMDLGADNRPLLLLRFWKDVEFKVESAADFRSITVRARPMGSGASTAAPAGASLKGDAVTPVMQEARRAMVARDYDRAIALYTIVLRASSGAPESVEREALEYLGLARQKNGQIAHARAEYGEYLDRYPDGEGAERVRQRLAALATANVTQPAELKRTRPRTPTDFDFYGSLYTTFFRTESFADLSGAELINSSQYIDADLNGRMRRGSFEMRARGTGGIRIDYDTGEVEVPSRITRLYLGAYDHQRRLGGAIGRQSSPGAGVLGRLDGVTASWGFAPKWTVHAVGGFPILSSVTNTLDTSAQVFGVSVESRQLVEGLSAELYAVGQLVEGTTDRAAIGLEARYLDERWSLYGLLDFDFHFVDLNVLMLSGSWRITDATTVNGLVDYRYSPFLTSRNALLGQPFSNLGALETAFSADEIKGLARDRTTRVTTLVAGAAHRFNERFEINGDFTASQIGDTPTSGGVPGFESSDWFFYYTAQLVSWGWLTESGSERFGLRFFDGDRYNAFSTVLSGRYRLPHRFRLSPELRFEYRNNRDSQNFIELAPGLRVEYRIAGFVLDVDFLFQWLKGLEATQPSAIDDELGYVLNVGARYDF